MEEVAATVGAVGAGVFLACGLIILMLVSLNHGTDYEELPAGVRTAFAIAVVGFGAGFMFAVVGFILSLVY